MCLVALALVPAPSARAGVPITLQRSFAGNLDFVGTAGTLRVGDCGQATSGAGTLAGVPASATVEAAYLYWAGSGTSIDATVTLDTPAQSGITVSADRTFTETFVFGGTDYDYFSGVADVTTLVASGGNGTYDLSGLTFATGTPWSNVAGCLGGWSLVVIFEDAAEPLRVVNVFDGFQAFRGSSITLTPDNFVVPASPLDGKLGHITWEGDVGNSAALGGFQEQLRFEGTVLTDGDNPSNNQFNSISNVTTPSSTLPGVDFDVYDLGPPQLFAGQTSASTEYSSGGDLVLLTGEVFSVTNTPVADLSITKTDDGAFGVDAVEAWTLTVSNAGPNDEPGPITVTDPLPAGVTYQSAGGGSWSCSESGGTVTCTHPGPLAAGTTLADTLSIDVLVDASALPEVVNTATVSGTLFDNVSGNDSATRTTPVVEPDFSTSTKTVVDLNGGDAEPGDVLRYTIALVESNGAPAVGVRVTDDVPGNVDAFAIVSLPAGASDASTAAPAGANGAGFVDVTGIDVPSGGTVEVVFDVTVAAAAAPGAVLSNTATITPATGTGATPAAPDVIVSASSVPASGTKALYLGAPAGRDLARTTPNGLPPAADLGNVPIDRTQSETWTLTPALAAPLSLSGADFPVVLLLRKGGTSGSSVSRELRVDIASTSLGTIASTTQTILLTGTPQAISFTMSPGATLPATLPAGDVVTLTVTNTTTGGGNRRLRVFPALAALGHSRVELDATTVINVDAVDTFDAAHPAGVATASFAPGDPVSIRAVVSDPFGAFDIAVATLELLDANGSSVLGPVAMSELASEQTASTKTFETLHTLSAGAAIGNWTARVVASEGEEGTITDLGLGSFVVANPPNLVVWKTVLVLDDPVNGTTNPKAIPGANVVYTIGVSNQGAGPADADSLLIEDALPAELELFVDVFGNRGPFEFTDGATASGVDLVFTSLADDFDDVEFDDGSALFALDPTPDGDGFDPSVTAIRLRPSGTLGGSSGAPPGFEIRFRARIR